MGDSPQKPTSITSPYQPGVIIKVTATDDDYWNAQSAAVRVLRTNPDPVLARKLAAQGNKILPGLSSGGGQDAMLLICNWLQQGWSWVPVLFQELPQLPPGVVDPGYIPYDPKNPPPGSLVLDYVEIATSGKGKYLACQKEFWALPKPPAPVPNPHPLISAVGGFECMSDQITGPGFAPPVEVHMLASHVTSHLTTEGEKYTDPTNGRQYQYHMLGNSLMDAKDRIGVLYGPLTK